MNFKLEPNFPVTVFDGNAFAAVLEEEMRTKVDSLPTKPKLMVITDLTNISNLKYTNLKEKFAQRIGVEFLRGDASKMADYNADETIQGIMVQLPHPDARNLISQIAPPKDVDGLRDGSPYLPAVVRAVKTIIQPQGKVLVIGSKGFVGQRLVREFICDGVDKEDFNIEKIRNADVIISATGQAGLIKPDMVKTGLVAIDLGYPVGDFDPQIAKKAAFFTPVPGGVGPVTVACLFANLLDSYAKQQSFI